MPTTHQHQFTVSEDVLDENDHVNNVAYVQWMQDVAIEHADVCGGTELAKAVGATWFARSHFIEYLRPTFEGDVVEARTWVETFGRAKCTRKYEFVRLGDGETVCRGETSWVYVDAESGRPRAIPEEVKDAFRGATEG